MKRIFVSGSMACVILLLVSCTAASTASSTTPTSLPLQTSTFTPKLISTHTRVPSTDTPIPPTDTPAPPTETLFPTPERDYVTDPDILSVYAEIETRANGFYNAVGGKPRLVEGMQYVLKNPVVIPCSEVFRL